VSCAFSRRLNEFGGFDEFVSTEKQLKGLDESADFILNERFGRILDIHQKILKTMMDIKIFTLILKTTTLY
jgi:hypothetical protein